MPQELFFVKCRPSDADAWPIARDEHRVFIGYPARKADADSATNWRHIGFRNILVDLGASDHDSITTVPLKRGYKSQVSANRNLVRRIEPGSVVLVPRLGSGVCYAAEVSGPFELVDRPSWADAYLALRMERGIDLEPKPSHVSDVVQTWPVAKWHTLAFPSLPKWISNSLLSRRTCGIIKDLRNPKLSALETVQDLMSLPEGQQYAATQSYGNLEEALLTWLTPQNFEHLVVDLLRLEAADGIQWHHVGGSGDGGVDGIAVDPAGKLQSVLQCKLLNPNQLAKLANGIRTQSGDEVQIIVAILHGNQKMPPDVPGLTFWNRGRVADLVTKHAARLPIARTFGIY